MRPRLLLTAWLWLSIPALAAAHTSVGGGGADEPNSDCLLWATVAVSNTDAAVADAGDAGNRDGGRSDAGGPAVKTTLRCIEHATMFGCACTLGSSVSNHGAACSGVVAILLVVVAGSRRPRSTRRQGARR